MISLRYLKTLYLKKYKSVYFKLMISYIIIVLMSTLIIGSFSYFNFSSNFNDSLMAIDQQSISHLSDMINESVIEKAQNTFIDIASYSKTPNDFLYLLENPIDMNYDKVYNLYSYLTSITGFYDKVIHSIDIYFINSDTVVSSYYGVKHNVSRPDSLYANAAWIKQINDSKKPVLWTDATNNSSIESGTVMYLKTYPSTSVGKSAKAYICIRLQKPFIANLLSRFGLNASNQILMTSNNNISISTDTNLLKNQQLSILLKEHNQPSGNFIGNINNIKSMVSYNTMPTVGWRIVNITPISKFYNKFYQLLLKLFIVCLLTLIGGIFIAGLFTLNIYNPLKKITQQLRQLLRIQTPDIANIEEENEYAFINDAVNNFSTRMLELESTLDKNMPLIIHNLIVKLLYHTISSSSELDEYLKLARIQFKFSYFRAAVIHIGGNYNSMGAGDSNYLRYDLIARLESISSGNMIFFVSELNDYDIGIIVNLSTAEHSSFHLVIQQLCSDTIQKFGTTIYAGLGTLVETPLELNVSFNNACIFAKYHYLLPNLEVLTETEVVSRESSTNKLPEQIFVSFEEGLNTCNSSLIDSSIVKFVEHIKSDVYSYAYCHEKLMYFVSLLSKSTHIRGLQLNDDSINNLSKHFESLENIDQFHTWIYETTMIIFNQIHSRNENKNVEVVAKVRDYIDTHLSQDLTLSMIADQVYLSAPYLSKLFSEEMGMPFTNYVIQQRISKSKELILSTNLSVEEIACRTGFNSAGYFIKTFKRHCGITPRAYKSNELLNTKNN